MIYHLAQLNVAKLLYPLEHPNSADFYNNLNRINALAEQSEGFIWRLIDEDGGGNVPVHPDPLVVATLSVWENIDALKTFAFQSEHVEFLKRKKEWFSKSENENVVLWYVKVGNQPSLSEAISQLKLLQKEGDSPEAFSFRKIFPPPTKVK